MPLVRFRFARFTTLSIVRLQVILDEELPVAVHYSSTPKSVPVELFAGEFITIASPLEFAALAFVIVKDEEADAPLPPPSLAFAESKYAPGKRESKSWQDAFSCATCVQLAVFAPLEFE